MGAFHRGVLMGGIGASGSNVVVELLGEEGTNSRVMVEFAALVKYDIFVVDVGRVAEKPCTEPVDGATFGNTGGANKGASSMIGDKDVARFAVETKEGAGTLFVLGFLPSKGKIDRQALERDSSGTG
jgi:hypothetical protein